MSRVLAISGSLRTQSFNTQVLHTLPALAPEGLSIEVWKGLDELPFFNQDLEENPPASVVRLREAIREADGLIISTPEYNRQIPGVLKNALDWASRPYAQGVLAGKPVVAISASPSNAGGLPALIQLRSLLDIVGSYVVGGPTVSIPEVHNVLSVAEEAQAVVLNNEMTHSMLVKQLNGLACAIADNTAQKHVG